MNDPPLSESQQISGYDFHAMEIAMTPRETKILAPSACYRLLALARDLFQANDLRSVLDLIKPPIFELLVPTLALLAVELEGKDDVTLLDLGQPRRKQEQEQAVGLYRLIRQHTTDFDDDGLMVLPDVRMGELEHGDAAAFGTLISLAFPPSNPVGTLSAFWMPPLSEDALPVQAAMLRALSEIAGAALGNVVAKISLRERIAESQHAVADASRHFADELERREMTIREKDRLAITDVLTGMLNRRGFFERAEQGLKFARRNKMRCAVIFADVDGLKAVNDQLGHDTGDRLLRAAGQVFSASFRESDVAARLGGDEFAAFAIDTGDADAIKLRIATSIEKFHRATTTPYRISFSIGVVECDLSSEQLLGHYLALADKRMYQQKKARHGV